MPSNRIAAIGDELTLMPLKVLGIECFATDGAENDGAKVLTRWLKNDEYAVIFIVEDLLDRYGELIKETAYKPLPSVVLIPSIKGSKGLAESLIRETLKKAAGRDVLSDEE